MDFKIKKKGYLEISFGWLFALIVGALILGIAIYAAVKIFDVGETSIDAQTAKQIGILSNPLEMGIISASSVPMNLATDTRIYLGCKEDSKFGRQLINVSQKSYGKWTSTDFAVGFSNKYFFTEGYAEGKKFYLFSRPFNFPFKVADLIVMVSANKRYCFFNPPEDFEDEVGRIGQSNFVLNNCSNSDVKICFESASGCDVVVDMIRNIVQKDGDTLYFEGDALMMAAIFSEKNYYECQVKRLMKRTSELSQIYIEKGEFYVVGGCHSSVGNELQNFKSSVDSLSSSANLESLMTLSEELGSKNEDNSECRLW